MEPESSNAAVEISSRSWRLVPEHFVLFFSAAIFLTILGPFGTDADLAIASRFAYWSSVILGGAVVGVGFSSFFQRHARKRGKVGYALVTLAQVLVASVPVTLLVAGIEWWLREPIRLTELTVLYPYVLSIVAVITSASLYVRRHRALEEHVARTSARNGPRRKSIDSPGITRFHLRLEPHMRQDEITLLRAEDHYLHVSTAKDTVVIRCNLSVAVEELASVDGQRVHRSFWVSRSAIRSVKKHGNAYQIIMDDGKTVPLSRRRYRELSKCNWLPV